MDDLKFENDSNFSNDPGGNLSIYLSTIENKNLSPEKRIMLAVLDDALWCLKKYKFTPNKKARIIYSDAMEWIKSAVGDYVVSFRDVCDALNLDEDYLRQGIIRNIENIEETQKNLHQ